MTYELTKDGLFSYFGPEVVEKIIELPLVKRHLSAHDYCQSREFLSLPRREFYKLSKKNYESTHAILGFDALQNASVDEVMQYLSIEKIKDAYIQCYGDYFLIFQARVFSLQNEPHLRCDKVSPLLDLVSEKKLVLYIQAAMALPLQAFTNAIIEQDFLLQEIAAQLIYQAGKAREFIAIVQADDAQYKQTVVNLAFSIIRSGFSVFNVGELLNVSQTLTALAASAFDKIEEKLSALVSDIQNLVINTHIRVLQEAEKQLLSTTAPEEISLRWAMYRARIFYSANKSIKHILDGCVNNDDFFRCVIRETICQHEGLSQEMLLINATEKARMYIADIVKGLQSQVTKIRQIREAVISVEGSQNIETYFRKICLINYTMQHENSGSILDGWLTKKLGHRLSFYFPDIVFQKKWSSAKLLDLLYHEVAYSKQKLTFEEYQDRKKKSAVVLGLFRNSSRVKKALFANLEEQIPCLGDQLVFELQQQNTPPQPEDVFLEEDSYSAITSRYCFRRRRLSLFSFSEQSPEDSGNFKPIPKAESTVVLLARRDVSHD